MIYHVVTAADWNACPGQPYGPSSLAEDGFVHCSPDEATTLAVVNAFYRDASRPLLVLLLDEERLASRVVWEEAVPVPPPGVGADIVFPHVFGLINRDAVTGVLEIQWDGEGRATGMRGWQSA